MFDYKLLAALAAVVEQAGFSAPPRHWGCRSRRYRSGSSCSRHASVSRYCCVTRRPGPPNWASACSTMCSRYGCSNATCRDRSRRWMKTACRNACVSPSMPTPWRPGGRVQWRRSAPRTGCCSITWWKIRRSGSSACAQGGCGLRLRCGATGGGCAQPVSRGDALSRPGQPGVHRATFPAGCGCCGPGTCSCRGVRPGRPAAASLHGGGRRREILIHHLCPSSEGFVRLLRSGLGWGLAPELQVRGELARGELVDVLSGPPIDVPLYWHHWRNGGQLLDELTRHLVRCASDWLLVE